MKSSLPLYPTGYEMVPTSVPHGVWNGSCHYIPRLMKWFLALNPTSYNMVATIVRHGFNLLILDLDLLTSAKASVECQRWTPKVDLHNVPLKPLCSTSLAQSVSLLCCSHYQWSIISVTKVHFLTLWSEKGETTPKLLLGCFLENTCTHCFSTEIVPRLGRNVQGSLKVTLHTTNTKNRLADWWHPDLQINAQKRVWIPASLLF